MKSVILGDRLGSMKGELEGRTGPVAFVQLTVTQESFHVLEYLRQRPNTQEISAGELFRERRESFGAKYIQFIDRLNKANQCLEWWGMPITDKMPSGPDLCRDIASFLLVVELVRLQSNSSVAETLVVISDSADLGAQVRVWGNQEGVEVVVCIQTIRLWRNILKYHSPAPILLAFFKTVQSRWLLSRRYWPPPNTRDDHVVIHSLTHARSFTGIGGYKDAYFGPLVDYLAKSGQKALILAGIQEQPRAQLKSLRKVHDGLPILPVESCLTFGALLSALWRTLSWYARFPGVKGRTEIDGLDVGYLVNQAVREARHSGNLFMNLLVFYAARRLAETVPVTRWLYPFENLAWEKMLLLGAYSSCSEVRMIGYQHASITQSNAIYQSMVLPEQQEQPMPFPKMVVTTGDVTRQWLEAEGHYPVETTVRAACALRPAFLPTAEPKPREPRLSRILVALATNQAEYVRVLVFLEQAFSGVSGFEVRVRPHPSISVEPALKAASLPSTEFFRLSSETLQEDLQWAHVVLYASSTVALEAISLGIPTIYLDLGSFLDEDPMLGWSEFKWPVLNPAELLDAIKQIETIPAHEYQQLQRKGREYAAAYLTPVTEEGLRRFLEG